MVRPPPEDCAEFPTRNVGDSIVYRATNREYRDRPWWFSSLPLDGEGAGGRFDLEQPRGTSYWADDPLVAAAEVLLPDADDGGMLPASIITERVLVVDSAPHVGLGDFTVEAAASYGVTNELTTGPPPYDVPQDWARELDGVAEGVYYRPRQHTAGHSLAFFGEGGQRRQRPQEVKSLSDLRVELEEALRLRFVDSPALADLDPVVDSPGSNQPSE